MALRETFIESIKTELGYPIISLYITDEQIGILIEKAKRKCIDKACPLSIIESFVSGGVVDLTGKDVLVVKSVYPTTGNGDVNDGINFSGIPAYGNGFPNIQGSGDYINALTNLNYKAQYEDLSLSDFYLDGEKLYVDNFSGGVTLEVVKKNPAIEDLDSNWQSWVESYATALCKITEGRIRGKFKPQNSPFELESDNLVSEGESAKSELDSKLDMSMGYFNIVR